MSNHKEPCKTCKHYHGGTFGGAIRCKDSCIAPEKAKQCVKWESKKEITDGRKCGDCKWFNFTHHDIGPPTWCDHGYGGFYVYEKPPTWTTDAAKCPYYEYIE